MKLHCKRFLLAKVNQVVFYLRSMNPKQNATASKDYFLLQSLFTLQKTKRIFTLPKSSGKLFEEANKQKLPILAHDKDATKRRCFWNTWFMKLRIIVGHISSSANFISEEGTISLFDSNSSQATDASGAIFILVQSYVDKYYADQLLEFQ